MRVSVLIADHHTQSLAVLKSVNQHSQICLQVAERHSFLRQVHPFGASGEAAHLGQISAVTTHDLNYKTATGSDGRLFDFVYRFDDAIESSIGTDAQLR